MTEASPQSSRSAWRERIEALKNVPPVLGILWQSGPAVVTWGIILRVFVAALPAAIAYIAAKIINGVQYYFTHKSLLPHFWWLVGIEAGLNVLNGLLVRGVDYSDSLLADRYTHFVSVRVMRQAAALDLTTYEDPVFYDRLERARVQATDRLAMIQQMGRLFQQTLTTLIWTSILLWYSPWLVLLLALGVLPTFLGETHFAFLGYAKNFRQTPAKRQMDYLRQVAGSREGAKELKLFNLSDYLSNRFTKLSQGIYEENVALSRKKLLAGGAAGRDRYAWLLRCVCLRYLARGYGQLQQHWRVLLPDQCHHSGLQQSAAGVLYCVGDRGPGSLPHRFARLLRDETHGDVEPRWGVDTAPDPAWL